MSSVEMMPSAYSVTSPVKRRSRSVAVLLVVILLVLILAAIAWFIFR